ncbi:hypothetical protein KC950_03790 [Candidatus Saccharibacteria bacterium]|nr:hypothetical protein [Candidatus Saccharibacteria bacterium]
MERELEMETFRMPATIDVREEPLKATDGTTMTPEQVMQQAGAVREALRDVSSEAPGTCIDERRREGYLSGDEGHEARFSAPGGPNIYGLYMAELTGYFAGRNIDSKQRLNEVTGVINDAGIESGGHKGCAANAGFNAVLGLIAGDNVDAGREYAKQQLGNDFDEEAYNAVVENARIAVDAGTYVEWAEDSLAQELGDKAEKGIEILGGQHEGRTFARVNVVGKTVDQTELHNAVNEDTFINDEGYEERIESAIAGGPDAEWKQKVARHAREALLAALFPALPNSELHQINITQ